MSRRFAELSGPGKAGISVVESPEEAPLAYPDFLDKVERSGDLDITCGGP